MALGSLLVLLDDIAAVLDDVALLTRVAAKKSAGVLGDDLAVNAEKVTGIAAERELPVVRAVALGSLRNKAILVPAALLLSAWLPAAITPLLVAGGLYLCFEGAEKVWHALGGGAAEQEHEERAALVKAMQDPDADALALEKDRIRGAVRTDFILSAEIIVITLGIVADAALAQRVLVLSVIALIMTVGVYGLVAVIVKLDDLGLALARRPGAGIDAALRALGRGLLALAPRLMRTLTVVGTLAMFLVGGGILVHNVELLHHALDHVLEALHGSPMAGDLLEATLGFLLPGLVGLAAGLFLLLPAGLWRRIRAEAPPAP